MESARKFKPDQDNATHPGHHPNPTPWVSAAEFQPPLRPQAEKSLDEVDEALMESFPCSDPPCYTHAHA